MVFLHWHPSFHSNHHHLISRQRQKEGDSSSSSTVVPTAFHADPYEVVLEPAENPQELPLARRWLAVLCISTASICVTCASSMVRPWHNYGRRIASSRISFQAAFAEGGIGRQFHVSKEVTILGVSLFVLGLGLGPIAAGPMSEIYGRSAVYRVSFSFFFLFMFPVAFAPNIGKCVRCPLS